MSTAAEQATHYKQVFEQAAKLYESAVHAGIQIQEHTLKSLGETMGSFGSPADWQKRNEAAAWQALGAAQKNTDDAIRMMNENAKTCVDLLQSAFNVRQDESSAETQGHVREMWETAIGSLRRNIEVMLQANNRVLESWREIMKIMNGRS
ncbi:MAG: hypothetical protein ACOY3P_17935 [Planctomycetota bacterium]